LSEAFAWRDTVWRIVETQHIASTMKLVDSFDEQEALEILLEQSKPQVPYLAKNLDYLLFTPFRYSPKRGGSRFRSEIDPGVFYGAQSIRTAGAELGFWRWKFLKDSIGLESIGPVAQTVFSCMPSSLAIDLRQTPFSKGGAIWESADQYLGAQDMGRVARKAGVQSILYRSVRDQEDSWCVAILDPTVFNEIQAQVDPHAWFLSVTQETVLLKSSQHFYEYQFHL
jgi:hypothetical protein